LWFEPDCVVSIDRRTWGRGVDGIRNKRAFRPAVGPIDIGPGLIGLLALGMFINYVDRGNLATAAPLIKDELGLSNTEAGILLSAFFWTYMPFQLVAGWLAERFSPYRILAIGVAV
jgi:MFS family permease